MGVLYKLIQIIDVVYAIQDILSGEQSDSEKLKEIKKYTDWVQKEVEGK